MIGIFYKRKKSSTTRAIQTIATLRLIFSLGENKMSRPESRSDGLSPSTNIAALSMEAQQEANRLENEKIQLTRKANKIAMIAAIAATVAAITAIIAAVVAVKAIG